MRPGGQWFSVWATAPDREPVAFVAWAPDLETALDCLVPRWATVYRVEAVTGPHALALT